MHFYWTVLCVDTMNCHGCKAVINKKNSLKCNNCSSSYCYLCLNINVDSSEILNAEQLASLSCPSCQNVTRRKVNDNTPVKHQHDSLNKTMNVAFSKVSTDSQSYMNASAGPAMKDEPVTMESISRLFDLKLSPDSTFMTNLRSTLKKDVEEMVVVEVNRAIEKIKFDLTSTSDFISAEQIEMKSEIAEKDSRIKELESEVSKTHEVLSKLKSRINTVEKLSRDMNIEIHEVPESKDENLTMLFRRLCECLQVPVSDADIRACRRIAKMNPDSRRPRNILVSLSSQRMRDALLSATTRFNKVHSDDKLCLSHIGIGGATSRVFLSEHLSPEVKELHSLARKFCKDKNYKFVWVRFGQIYIRRDEKCPAILIKNFETITKLYRE